MDNELIRDALVAVGYEFVQFDFRVAGTKDRWNLDALAWAADANGALVPWAVIETKRSRGSIRPELDLSALARARDMLGTVDHYVVVNDTEWYRADSGLQKLIPVTGPEAPPHGGQGAIADDDLATALLSDQLWKEASRARAHGTQPADFAWGSALLDLTDFQTPTGARLPVDKATLWQARRRALVDFERRGKRAGIYTSHKGVAKAVAQLSGSKLTGDLLDPFCGVGSFLWECIEYAQENQTGLNDVVGCDSDERTVDVARSIGSASPVPVEIITADAFQAELPPSTCVVSAPPMGLRLREPHELLDGSSTRDGELVALDRILSLLGQGGRAVLQLSVGLTFRNSDESYRRYLASEFRVAAILGLPSGAVTGSAIRSILMVIERTEQTDTFIAQLGEDWESQLAPGGAALEAALAHIDGVRS